MVNDLSKAEMSVIGKVFLAGLAAKVRYDFHGLVIGIPPCKKSLSFLVTRVKLYVYAIAAA